MSNSWSSATGTSKSFSEYVYVKERHTSTIQSMDICTDIRKVSKSIESITLQALTLEIHDFGCYEDILTTPTE